jgi:predicted transcriptional regulator of viral defense system
LRKSRYAAATVTEWTFLTNHAHVLLCIARDPDIRLRDVADYVGITERAAQRIVSELVEAGYLERTREGRRNSYRLNGDVPLRHPLDRNHAIGDILDVLNSGGTGKSKK